MALDVNSIIILATLFILFGVFLLFDLFKRNDYIFCLYDLEPIKSEILCSDASDHCAVITTVK